MVETGEMLDQLFPDKLRVGGGDGLGEFVARHPVNAHRLASLGRRKLLGSVSHACAACATVDADGGGIAAIVSTIPITIDANRPAAVSVSQ